MIPADQEKLTENYNLFLDRVGEQTRLLQDAAYMLGFKRAYRERLNRQTAILQWANATFGEATASNKFERVRRFAEESIELAQAIGLSKLSLIELIDHVYGKPVGDIEKEIGQCGVALLALAEHMEVNADDQERKEFERIISLPPEHWQARQNAKAEKGLGLETTAE